MDETIYSDNDCLFRDTRNDKMKRAEARIAELTAAGAKIEPVIIPARGKIAKTFWGHLWCRHIEAYEDMSYRLDLGRSHARTNSVIDLQVTTGKISAIVVDVEVFDVVITVAPISDDNLENLCRICSREVASVVDLLSGRLSDDVMTALTSAEANIFPNAQEIKFSCNCLDYADMCLHAAATLYALSVVGDKNPEAFFKLRGIDSKQLIGQVGAVFLDKDSANSEIEALAGHDLGALFGIDLVES